MRTERNPTPPGSRKIAAVAGALLHLSLCGLALAAPLGSFGNHDVTSARGINPGSPDHPRAMADVDGDGRADYCRFVGNPSDLFLSCTLATSDGRFGSYEMRSDPGFDRGYWHHPRGFADVNGDGRADYCRFVGASQEVFLSCALATADLRFGRYDVNSRKGGFDAGLSAHPRGWADVNGDGRADYCRFVVFNLGVRLSCALATATGFGENDVNSEVGIATGEPGLPRGFYDANGDGLADYCRFLGSASARYLSCTLTHADGSIGPEAVNGPTTAAGFDLGLSSHPRGFGDVTGDGRVDYCRFLDSPAVLSCAAADGDGGFGNRDVESPQAAPTPYPVGEGGQLRALADVNADGRADYCRFISEPAGAFLSCGLSRPLDCTPPGVSDF